MNTIGKCTVIGCGCLRRRAVLLEQWFKKGLLLNFGNGLGPDNPDLRISLRTSGP